MYDVITVGSATVDVFVDTESELIKIKSVNGEEELMAYPVGSKILVKRLDFLVGGGGSNTAVALSKLGHKVGYVGKLGRDEGGDRVLAVLRKNKIDFLGALSKEMTAYSIVLDSIEHDRTILAYKGAMDTFVISDINIKRLRTRWFYFSSLVDKSYKALEQLAAIAQKSRIPVMFNPSTYLAAKGAAYLRPVLTATTILVLNKEEAELIVGKAPVKELLAQLRRTGPAIVVITNGKEGAYCSGNDCDYFVKAHTVKVVEATGAGDAFAASFLSGMMKKNDIKFALKLGIANAESVVQGRGPKTNLLSYQAALRRMRENPSQIKRI